MSTIPVVHVVKIGVCLSCGEEVCRRVGTAKTFLEHLIIAKVHILFIVFHLHSMNIPDERISMTHFYIKSTILHYSIDHKVIIQDS